MLPGAVEVSVRAMSLLLVGCVHAAPSPEALGPAAWLAGSWQGDGFSEHWTAPVDGMMAGQGWALEDGRIVFFEHLALLARPEGLVYRAWPGGGRPTDFVATHVAPGELVFENPGHDFPRRIAYRLEGEVLTVQLEGEGDPVALTLVRESR